MIYRADPAALPFWSLYPAALRGYRTVRAVDRWPWSRVAAWQQARLAALDGANAAPLEKAALRQQSEQLIAADSARDWVVASTSGSTGEPLRLAMTIGEYGVGLATVAYGFRASGVRWTDRIAHLCVPATSDAAPRHERFGLLRARRIDLRQPAVTVWSQLAALQPKVLYGYPSHLELLATARPPELSWRAERVISNGEPLTAAARTMIEQAFAPIVLDSYGCVEIPRVAFACAAGRLHELSGAVLIEIDKATLDDEGCGDLLLTSLYHRALPLRRYRVGDRGRVESDVACACGRRGRVLAQLQGRRDDRIALPEGRWVSARAVSLLETFDWVRAFQLVQTERARLLVRVVPNRPPQATERDAAVALVHRGLGATALQIELELVAALETTAGGKRRAVISQVGS